MENEKKTNKLCESNVKLFHVKYSDSNLISYQLRQLFFIIPN